MTLHWYFPCKCVGYTDPLLLLLWKNAYHVEPCVVLVLPFNFQVTHLLEATRHPKEPSLIMNYQPGSQWLW